MSIKHLVQNHLIEQFFESSSEIIPEISVNILSAGDDWTTVKFESTSKDDEDYVVSFLNQFDELNY